jgi:probable rRNA maturation factor
LDGESCINVSVSPSEKFAVDENKITTILQFAAARIGVSDFELSVSFVDSKTMTELNSNYRQKDYDTDVLSFPMQEWTSPLKVAGDDTATKPFTTDIPQALGDLVVSLAKAEENARDLGQSLDREVCFLLVHGLLHLCGHDHESPDEEETMLAEQRKLMAMLDDGLQPLWQNCVRMKESTGRKENLVTR